MCGIAGIVTKAPRTFDYASFCILGISNDIRGGDSCGIFIDKYYEYGVGDNKFFSDFFINNEYLSNLKESSIAFLHCRKASVGAINEKTAQPVVIEENGKVRYVLMHNGTIYNYKELASKYIPDIDITGMTDSQVMARIFYYKGYDAIEEYYGGAVFAIADYRDVQPRIFLFKGASKVSEYNKKVEEERPLFFCIDKEKEELMFSSICLEMFALRKDTSIYYVPKNGLYEFNGTDLVLRQSFSRDKVSQTKPYTITVAGRNYNANHNYPTYLSIDAVTNKYSINGYPAHGNKLVSTNGVILSEKSTKGAISLWFYHGVLLLNKDCFDTLEKVRKKHNLPIIKFATDFNVLVRFLSLDKIFPIGSSWYIAIGPKAVELYTGEFRMITSYLKIDIKKGTRGIQYYDTYRTPILETFKEHARDINFKEIEEEC